LAFDNSTLEPAAIPAEDEALRERIRDFLASRLAHLPAERRARSWMGYDEAFSRDLGANGWIGLTLPREYGGQERSGYARFVVVEEQLAAGAPVAAHWIADRQSAPLLLSYGTEDQKRRLIPGVCRGELYFCIGMSEPNSGSDLASVRSRATKTAKGWRLDGAKIWTTYGHRAHYMIALVRTSGGAEDRSKGLSQFLIDLNLSGISRRPIRDLAGDEHFSEVTFDGVELADDALLGEEGSGWEQVNAELAFERSGPERIYSSMVLMDEWLKHVRAKKHVSEAEVILAGRLAGQLSTLREMSLSVTRQLVRREGPVFAASIVKDLGTSFEQEAPRLIADQIAASEETPPASLLATLEYVAAISPSFSLRGGTREILRGMIARGLGLR
jgi:alkylation response protein AidB-like acyl-CoA dehydrogenase